MSIEKSYKPIYDPDAILCRDTGISPINAYLEAAREQFLSATWMSNCAINGDPVELVYPDLEGYSKELQMLPWVQRFVQFVRQKYPDATNMQLRQSILAVMFAPGVLDLIQLIEVFDQERRASSSKQATESPWFEQASAEK
jgi:hypothetical protein